MKRKKEKEKYPMEVEIERMAQFHQEYYPVVYITFKSIQITNEIYEKYKEDYLRLLLSCQERNEKIFIVMNIDTFSNESFPLYLLKKQIDFHKQIQHITNKYVLGICIYCQNKCIKNILKTALSLQPKHIPISICRSIEKINRHIQHHDSLSSFDICSYISN